MNYAKDIENYINKKKSIKADYTDDNWQNNNKKQQLNILIDNLENLLLNYKNYLELLEHPEFQDEVKHELESMNLKFRQIILYEVFTEQDREVGFFMEIKTGVGGVDAQDWSMMLFRMYTRYFDSKNYKYNIVDQQCSDHGVKNVTLEVNIPVYILMGEIGIHRLVRISPFNSLGKRQTSFSSVYIYRKSKENECYIDKNDIKIDTFRASGAGGQHVNKTESAIRITHIPTGIVVSCQVERSQQQNRETAMSMLRSKILEKRKNEMKLEQKITEKRDVSWGEQFRSYVLDPYKIIKDSRNHIEIKSNVEISCILNGDLDKFIESFLWMKFNQFLKDC
jgi:peptide chain release factor 2